VQQQHPRPKSSRGVGLSPATTSPTFRSMENSGSGKAGLPAAQLEQQGTPIRRELHPKCGFF